MFYLIWIKLIWFAWQAWFDLPWSWKAPKIDCPPTNTLFDSWPIFLYVIIRLSSLWLAIRSFFAYHLTFYVFLLINSGLTRNFTVHPGLKSAWNHGRLSFSGLNIFTLLLLSPCKDLEIGRWTTSPLSVALRVNARPETDPSCSPSSTSPAKLPYLPTLPYPCREPSIKVASAILSNIV